MCVRVLWFDPDLPNESKTRQRRRKGSTFRDTPMDRDGQTISSSSGVLQPMTCLCANKSTSDRNVSARRH